ncbi:oligopeptidase A [Spongorhabdus nitratireducens]
MSNPLTVSHTLPPFSAIKPEHVEPAITQLLQEARAATERLLAENTVYTWDNLLQPLEAIDDKLSQAWSPVGHLNAVMNSDALRDAYNSCLPKLSEYSTWVGQHKPLFEAYQQIADGPEFAQLDNGRQKAIKDALRNFRLAGVALREDKQNRYKEISKKLSELCSKFSDNVLDATQAWSKLIESESELEGLPQTARDIARQQAQAKDHDSGWLFNLEFPSYFPVMTYSANRELRREMYEAYNTRASDQGPTAGQFDNGPLMDEILALRHEKAQLLGFENYAELSLASKMAENPQQVVDFLRDLAERSKPQAEQELESLQAFAAEEYGVDKLEAWDIGFYSEKLREHRYAISQEELRPWFPADNVIKGMFTVVKRLYGIDIVQGSETVDIWHKDAQYYEVQRDGITIAGFFVDNYARENKRGGAWMDECRVRRLTDDSVQLPVAYLTCNFTPAVGDQPALLTHDEVVTMFHEFGHGLHHMLTKVDYAAVSGINGVAWDAVELPSQFMENWCWEKEGLALISGHVETGEPLPDDKLERLLAAKNFQSAMMMVRQLEFSLFDFRLHREYQPGISVQKVLDEVRDEVAVIKPPVFNRFQNGFSHIFAGGYAAGYYSYKWAEVLSADAFSLFEENGIFDHATGESFLNNILEKGGSEEPMELFVSFRGREPKIDALLRHCGIASETEAA